MVQGVAIEDGCLVNTNPATGEVISRVAITPLSEIDGIVSKAQDALLKWTDTPIAERIQCLRDGLGEHLSEQAESLTTLMVREMGKPIEEAREEIEEGIECKGEYLDLLAESLQPQTHGTSVILRQALGVVFVVAPWNFPVGEILLLALPALASGNTVIVKPSEVTPECGAVTIAALQKALPHPDILQLCQGDGSVGSALVKHAFVDMVAMTGSSATGRFILEHAAKTNMKRVVLELGGKDPMVVFGDAKLKQAAKDAVTFSLSNTGQVCCSTERIYVEDSVKEEFEQMVLQEVQSYKVGNGLDPTVKVGPMVSAMQRDKVAAQVNSAVEEGATLLHTSAIPTTNGTFYPVTVLTNVSRDMNISKEETFGPVVCLSTFDGSEREAIALANNTEYGLASSVYTEDLEKAKRVANRIRAGQVGINCYSSSHMDMRCPWVGHKSSGFGFHSGVDGFHQFSIPKTLVYVPSGDADND